MADPRPTHHIFSPLERHRTGVQRLVTDKLPGAWADGDIDDAFADEAAGRGLALVAENDSGTVEGFMRFEVGNAPDGSVDATTAKMIDFVSINQAGLPLLQSLPRKLTAAGFHQVIADTDESMAPALESLGWTVFAPGFGVAWAVPGERHARFSEPRTFGSRPLAAHLNFDRMLRAWPYRYAADAYNFGSRTARIAQWMRLTEGGTMLRSEHTRLP